MTSVLMATPGIFLAYLRDEPAVLLHRIAALHRLQDVIAARLDGQVYLLADLVQSGDGLDELEAHVLGVVGQEAQARQPVDGI